MRYLLKSHEHDGKVYVHVSTFFEPIEVEIVHQYGMWDSVLCDLTPPSFKEQYRYASELNERLDQLHQEYQRLPFWGYDADKDEIRREIAAVEAHLIPVPTHNWFWTVRPARLIENPLCEIPFADYEEASRAEREIDRALRAFARRLEELVPEPEPEPEPEELEEPIYLLPYFADELRYEGFWLVGHRGAGKTQALQTFIQRDLERMAQGEDISILLMDSQGISAGDDGNAPTILYLLTHNKLFAPGQPLHGRLTYISPRQHPGVALNLFDLGFPGSREETTVATRELLLFILAGMVGDVFTPGMNRLLSRALEMLPTGATITDLTEIISKARANDTTRDAVLDRLDTLTMFPDFKRMLSYPRTAFSLFDELEEGRVVVIDTSSRSRIATAVVGRFFLALLDSVCRARADVPARRKTPTFIYIDELAAYCREHASHLAYILAECRKQNMQLCCANQLVSQIHDTEVRDALIDSGIKLFSREEDDLPRGIFLLQTRGNPDQKVEIPYPNLSAMPRMTKDEYNHVQREMCNRYSSPPPEQKEEGDTEYDYYSQWPPPRPDNTSPPKDDPATPTQDDDQDDDSGENPPQPWKG